MDGLSALPFASTGVQPIIWPESATTAMSDGSAFVSASSCFVDAHTARHQSSGACSAQQPLKKLEGYATVALPSRVPAAVYSVALSPLVPRSCARIRSDIATILSEQFARVTDGCKIHVTGYRQGRQAEIQSYRHVHLEHIVRVSPHARRAMDSTRSRNE